MGFISRFIFILDGQIEFFIVWILYKILQEKNYSEILFRYFQFRAVWSLI